MQNVQPETVIYDRQNIDKARFAFRGSLESALEWRKFFDDSKYHNLTYWVLIATVFSSPGISRNELIDQLTKYANISRTTAERAISDAKQKSYIVDKMSEARTTSFVLGDELEKHCIWYFENYMNAEALMDTFGTRQ
jgi:hypothetical protein